MEQFQVPDFSSMSRKQKLELNKLLEEKIRLVLQNKIARFYPEHGSLSRTNYPKHMSFFDAGKEFSERCLLAANRIGKTEGVGCFETTCHLTGKYPDWWTGRRYTTPITAWAATTTNEKTRDILQRKYYGPLSDKGTGLIPAVDIVDASRRSGIPDAIENIIVKHYTQGIHDGNSVIYLKSYAQGRDAFQGEEVHVIHLDEEPPMDIYTECLLRTMATDWFDGGIIICTFTPMEGITEVTELFMPGALLPETNVINGRFMVNASWDDAPHLSESEKERLWASIPPYQRDARTKGIPMLGSGAIYPIAEDDIYITDFELPEYFPRAYGFDVGWKCTAGLWGAWDLEKDIIYIYAEYKRGQAEPLIHASNIKARGDWIRGVGDPASRASSQKDGEKLYDNYRDLGLKLFLADNAVEAGLFDVYCRFVAGKIKIFKSCANLRDEMRLYRRDKNGKVVKENDHLLDCLRYLVRSGRPVAHANTEQRITDKWHLNSEQRYNPLYDSLLGIQHIEQDYNPLYGQIRGQA